MDDEEKESKLMMADNAISTLGKVIYYQQDGGNLVKDEFTVQFLNLLPLTTDFEES